MGQKLAAYDTQGAIIAFYDSIDSPAPEGVAVTRITDEQWRMLLAGQKDGKRLAVNESREAVLLDPLPPSRADLAAAARAARDVAMASTDWLVARHQDEKLIGDGTTLTTDQFTVLLKYRQALRELSGAVGWPNIDLPAVPDFLT
ncbi:phage tail assembly chaperone [Paraburkholderia sp. SEWSISQ10-3 4]|uniref:phage tail assembly chaperone n=1 Tax=Paraburkholderia TaxID=1822464 RepID=UPI00225115A1|nr:MULTISPECIES: phage tail assembly chaperone [Paraburkholderia]MCX4139358.1 phage tail assembly chaperone [Paraburkholderia aspalathi]MDN7172046.1 phage tail assembly chaperone [Paraburkholderia sp. SEWSISQ10-3 4]MDQ6501685.1 phage tail assembly chaperone [Paraburkholderia aspalathi]